MCTFRLGILVALSLLIMSMNVSAAAPAAPWHPSEAAVHLRPGQRLQRQTIRCQVGQRVGLWAESNTTTADLTIEGCDVGVVFPPTVESPPLAPIKNLMQRLKVRQVRVGFWLGGDDSVVTDTIVAQTDIGFFVSGTGNTLERNLSEDNRLDGYLIVGHRNVLRGNEAFRNRGSGIRVASRVPQVGPLVLFLGLSERAIGNELTRNIALQNGTDLVEFGETCMEEEMLNTWSANRFGTRRPACIE